jgi:hypothetical protein
MILYNTTVKINHDVHSEWVAWMKVVQLPAMMETGLILEYTISRLLGTDETDGFTYSIQYLMSGFSDYQVYQEKHAAEMQKRMHIKYEGKYVVFRTVMKVIERSV